MRSILLGITTKAELIKKLGVPPKKEGDKNFFYDLSGRKYDTTIGLQKGKVTYIYYKLPLGKLFLRDLKNAIPKKVLAEAYKKKYQSTASRSSGRTFTIIMNKQNIKLTVRNNKNESIESVFMWDDDID